MGPWVHDGPVSPWAHGPFICGCCGPIIPLCGPIIPLCGPYFPQKAKCQCAPFLPRSRQEEAQCHTFEECLSDFGCRHFNGVEKKVRLLPVTGGGRNAR